MRFWVVSRLEFTERSVCSAVIAAVLVSKLDIDLSLDSTMNGFSGTYRICTGTTARHHAFGPGMRGRPIRRLVRMFNRRILPEAEQGRNKVPATGRIRPVVG